MHLKRLLAGLLLGVLSACGGRGCAVGDTVTLIYNDVAPIDARTQIMIGKDSVGFVEAVEPAGDGQRIVMRLREAAVLHEDDVYLPLQDIDGKIGLQVQPGGGKPLVNGALIYFPKRPEVVQPAALSKKPSNFTPLDAALPEPLPDDAPGSVVTFKEDTYARRSIRRAMAEVLEQTEWPEPVKKQADAVYDRARRPGDEMALLAQVGNDLPALHTALAEVAQQAYHKGDQATARQALMAIQRVVMLQDRVSGIRQRGGRPVPPAPGAEP